LNKGVDVLSKGRAHIGFAAFSIGEKIIPLNNPQRATLRASSRVVGYPK